MNFNKRVSLITIIIVVATILFGIIIYNIATKDKENNQVVEKNSKDEALLENSNLISQEKEENQKNNDYKLQEKNMQDKINTIDASEFTENIPNDLVLKINGEDVSYDYNWTYNQFKEKYNQENIFEEGKSNYYLLYNTDDLNYRIDFKLFPTVTNSVSNVALGVSNIEFSKKSDNANTNKDWNIVGIYLQDDLIDVLNKLGKYDVVKIRKVEDKLVNGITCSWEKVWFGDKYANISIKFDTNFKVESINISTIIYNTQKIDKYKSESKHVSN